MVIKTSGPNVILCFLVIQTLVTGETGGVVPNISNWTDKDVNTPEDRRFMQSAGPFTLKKGAINYITVGIPWARSTGSPGIRLNYLELLMINVKVYLKVF
jgi:hypothetical protein